MAESLGQRTRAHEARPDFDVVGIGALNIDYIIRQEANSASVPEPMAELSRIFDIGREKNADERLVAQMLRKTLPERHVSVEAYPGGSASNAIRALADLNIGLRLGFVGVSGRTEAGVNPMASLKSRGVDCQIVEKQSPTPGRCLSWSVNGERQMLTTLGANVKVAELLVRRREEVVDYLLRARWIHLTSLLDEQSSQQVQNVLAEVRQRAPAIRISVDPGQVWIDWLDGPRSAVITEILRLADVLFVNEREFQDLGHPGTDRTEIVDWAGARTGNRPVYVVLKKYDLIYLIERLPTGGKPLVREFPTTVVPHRAIVDDTGAGDVFAAGFIAGRVHPLLHTRDISNGVNLGLQMARQKLMSRGDRGYSAFADLARDVFQALQYEEAAPPTMRTNNGKVFIVHGRDPNRIRDAVARRLQSWGLEYVLLGEESGGGKTIIEMLEEHRDDDFAVVILTPDDVGGLKSGPSQPRARQNVILELGYFMGALGRSRHAAVFADDLELPSDYLGVKYIKIDTGDAWIMRLGQWLLAAGFNVNLANTLI